MMQQLVNDVEVEESTVYKNLMAMTIDDMQMLVPQKEIDTFESVHDLNTKDTLKNSIGWVQSHGKEIPVYGFTKEFEIDKTLLSGKTICVILDRVNIAIMCNDIKVMADRDLKIVPLPDSMLDSKTPVTSLCLYTVDGEEELGLLFDAKSISRYVGGL